jgi:S1-C subfamily serine protease
MIRFPCTQCRTDYTVPDGAAGKTTTCRQCGHPLTVPSLAVQPPVGPPLPVPEEGLRAGPPPLPAPEEDWPVGRWAGLDLVDRRAVLVLGGVVAASLLVAMVCLVLYFTAGTRAPVPPEEGQKAQAPAPQKGRLPLKELFKSLSPAVPLVETDVATGSGLLVKHKGKYLVVTNRHVIENGGKGVAVRFLGEQGEDRLTVSAALTKVVAVHRSADLAVLDVNAAAEWIEARIEPVRLAAAWHRPEVGEHAFAIGHPAGGDGVLTRTLSDGIVSAVGREVEGATFLQMTVPVNPGNSGGPLFDDDGRAVGVNTFVLRKAKDREMTLEGLNFALEVRYVHELLNDPSMSLTAEQIARVLRPDGVGVKGALVAALRQRLPPFVEAGYRPVADEDGKDEVRTFRLSAGSQRTFRLRLSAGGQYAVVAVARGTDDIDLAVMSPAGRLVARDLGPDAYPQVTFRAAVGGRYYVVVHNPTGEDAVVALQGLKKAARALGGD